jgi:hypothetical protein
MLEMRRRKAGKNGVVTTLGIPEGQTVTVVRIDTRTELVSMEPEERIKEMVEMLTYSSHPLRFGRLMERVRGLSHAAAPLPRARQEPERTSTLTEADAKRFAFSGTTRRRFAS